MFSVEKIEVQASTFAIELLLPDKILLESADCSIYTIAKEIGIPKDLVYLKNFARLSEHMFPF